MGTRTLYVLYGISAYAVFAVTLVWAAVFIAPLHVTAFTTVDFGTSASPFPAAVVDLALLGLFAVQHTVMARGSFKRRLIRVLPAGAERSTFVLAASVVLLLTFWQWRPITTVVWDTRGLLTVALWAIYALGWTTLVSSTFMIDHFDLFGLRQAFAASHGAQPVAPAFKTAWLYATVRHPMMTGFLILLWATPRMTAGHLLFAAAASGYIFVGIWFEERDLLRAIPEYAEYRRRVGALVPRPRRGAPATLKWVPESDKV